MLKLQGEVQVFKKFDGEKKTYLTLQEFENGSQFQVGVELSEGRNIKPGQTIQLDAPIFIGRNKEGGTFFMLPQGLGATARAKAG